MLEIIIIGAIVLVALIIGLVLMKFIGIWIRARVSNAPVGLLNLVAMWIRKVPPALIVDSRITAVKAGLDFTTDQLEAHYLAGGHVDDVVLSMIAADKAAIPLTYDRACAIDLAVKGTSKTVLEAVRTSINPAVIDCPGGGGKIDAVARDGIQLRARARVTVRTNLERFVGGATEETIIARVNEGIVTSIGSAQSHKDVLENPDHISHRVLERGLDANTQFEILSIDIADVDVGENIGATLQASQAEADKQVAQAKAEVRRAAAVATEQEMSARTQEMRAKLVEAEAEIPMAIAEAFRSGNLGVMDYTNYRNIVADTQMRQSIADEVSEDEEEDPHQH
ncbi:MAG: flotillin-like protein FloA [Verrucomicrobiales bacterium]|nr:flotillin-like protein FloA [Verrucomicrobiales bacterium]